MPSDIYHEYVIEKCYLPNNENLATDDSNEHSTLPTWKPESRLDFKNYVRDSNLDQIDIDLDILNQSDFVYADSTNSITLQISQTLVGAAENCNMIKNKNNSIATPQNRLKSKNLGSINKAIYNVKSISLPNLNISSLILVKIMKIWYPVVESIRN